MSWPIDEVEISADLVRDLLTRQFPDYATLPLRLIGTGFDNSMWRAGRHHVVRLPRRHVAVDLVEHELRWVNEVTRSVSVATPAPLRRGEPQGDYPWPWALGSWIDGTPGDEIVAAPSAPRAEALARFLRELHAPAPSDAPHNPARSLTLSDRAASTHERLAALELADRDEVERVFHVGGRAALWPGPPSWIHGDFHPGNTIYRHGSLVGVVDFGDLCAGDPASDLAGGLMALPFEALERFFTSYGSVDDDTRRRTLGWAVSLGIFFLTLGQDRPSYTTIGRRALDNATALARDF